MRTYQISRNESSLHNSRLWVFIRKEARLTVATCNGSLKCIPRIFILLASLRIRGRWKKEFQWFHIVWHALRTIMKWRTILFWFMLLWLFHRNWIHLLILCRLTSLELEQWYVLVMFPTVVINTIHSHLFIALYYQNIHKWQFIPSPLIF